MNCTEFKAVLEQNLETDLRLGPSGLEHVATCVSCRREWDIHCQLDRAIEIWKDHSGIEALNDISQEDIDSLVSTLATQATPISVAEAVIRELELAGSSDALPSRRASNVPNMTPLTPVTVLQQPRVMPPVRGHGRAVIAASAACLLVLGLVARQPTALQTASLNAPNDSTLVRVAQEPNQAPGSLGPSDPITDADVPDVSETLTAVLLDLRSEYQEIASETTSTAQELVRTIPRNFGKPVQVEEDPFVERPPTEDPSRFWKPIGTRVETALGFLWNAVPSQIPSG